LAKNRIKCVLHFGIDFQNNKKIAFSGIHVQILNVLIKEVTLIKMVILILSMIRFGRKYRGHEN
jgi:hypothetical protein